MFIKTNFFLVSAMTVLMNSNSMAAVACKDLLALSDWALLTSIRSEASQTPIAQPVVEEVTGVVEQRLRGNKVRIQNIERSAENLIRQMDLGGSDWSPLSSTLIDEVSAAMKEYNHTSFSRMTSQRTNAIEKIRSALRNSSEFGSLESKDINNLSQSFVQRQAGVFGAKHLLYHALVEFELNKSQSLIGMLVSLQKLGKDLSQVYGDNMELESFLSAGLKGMSSVREIEMRYLKLQSELNSVSKIPDDLVNTLSQIAKEYQASNRGNFDRMTPGHHQAIEKYRELIKTHSFFKDADSDMLDNLQWTWNQATTPEAAKVALSHFAGNSEVETKRRELESLARAIQFLRGNRG